jgi:hypothetical protein
MKALDGRGGRRLAITIVAVLAAGHGAVLAGMSMLEEALIFFPAKYPEGLWQPKGLTYEDAWFTAADGTRLHGWYCPNANPRAVVLFAHGNAGNLSHRADALRIFQQRLGCSIMVFDYRGYGRSEGKPSEAGILADARAARAWLAQRTNLSEDRLVLLGESLGGAVMVDLAAERGARGLILENTFSSLPDVAKYHLPWLPLKLLMRTRFDSLSKIDRYHGPLLMCHGTGDRTVPVELARKLFDRANEPKQLVIVPGGDHNDPPTETYLAELDKFLSGLP